MWALVFGWRKWQTGLSGEINNVPIHFEKEEESKGGKLEAWAAAVVGQAKWVGLKEERSIVIESEKFLLHSFLPDLQRRLFMLES